MIKIALLAALLLFSTSVLADTEAAIVKGGTVMVITSDKPCTDKEILKLLKDQYHPVFKAGLVAGIDGSRVEMCWAHSGDIDSRPGYRVMINVEGKIAGVPENMFFKADDKIIPKDAANI